MGKEIVTQVQETQKVSNRINPRQNTPRHILIKLTKIRHKEQILKAAREKQQITHKGIRIRWPKYWSFSFTIIPSKEIPGLISSRMDWLDLLAVQEALKSLLQH